MTMMPSPQMLLARHGLCLALCAALMLGTAAHAQTDWPLHGRDELGHRFSPLNQIHRDNVADLAPAWRWKSGISATFQATPIVTGTTMYLSLPGSSVAALDARTGQLLWRYTHRSHLNRTCCGPANRGVAVSGGRVFVGTVDGKLVALDAADGKVLWEVTVAKAQGATESFSSLNPDDPLAKSATAGSTGAGIGAAPIVHDGKVYIGINGVGYGLHPDTLAVVGIAGQYGQPGLMAAYDAKSGDLVWRFQITNPGWEGTFNNHLPDGTSMQRSIQTERASAPAHRESWRHGGGSIYASAVVDVAQGLLIFGTGNPSPQMADDTRPGDNLYTSSLVALDLKTGQLRWHVQQVPHDRWGYDVASSPVLIDWLHQGHRIPAVAHASKLGWVFVHDRRDGRFLMRSEAFVPQRNLFTPPQPGEGVVIAPGIAGGNNWSPVAWDARRDLLYVAGLHLPTRYVLHESRRPDGSIVKYASTQASQEPHWGTLSAVDLAQGGRIRWQVKTPEPLLGGVLATAGDLVFSGAGQGRFAAFDSQTGQELWSAQANAGVNAPPITYVIDGRQYVAVAAGGNALFGFKQGDELLVFALPEKPGVNPR